ncbi:GntR family transcriptional regulator [Bacillus sp. ISL-47]|uniref:GntR family transcriptional regulator n=1 Tax=Bacillus sp. ISL-47 TaxID=2819130 RepID=UPI001BE7AF8A|nr:GntR family transcriptional regulator [Bacillus sp. ISL-47]MBT2686802.1 GntR family transcriptional regulator [Bacillus sp. ISL-47]MBT2706845.1 GntR family transcriptional regulator [Pseudomonas sp. ISL-84]
MSNAQRAYEAIKEKILTGSYEPGQTLTEHQLVDELEMSRTPIRQALHKLTIENLLKSHPNKGVVIKQMTAKEIQDLFEFRYVLEKHVYEQLFAQNKVKEAYTQLTEIQTSLKNTSLDALTIMKIDHLFHKKVIELTGNSLILANMENIRDQILLIGTKILSSSKNVNFESNKEHDEILEALRKEDLKEVINKVNRHIENTHKRILLV